MVELKDLVAPSGEASFDFSECPVYLLCLHMQFLGFSLACQKLC